MFAFLKNERLRAFWKNDRLLAILLNTVIGILLFCVFLQCGIFLNGYASTRAGDAQIPFDMRMLSAGAPDAGQPLDTELLLPAVIAVSENGTAKAVLNAVAVMQDLYDALGEYLADGFKNEPQEKDEAFWQSAITSPDAVYIRYHAPLPYQILHAFAAAAQEDETHARDARSVTVEEICLCFQEEQTVLAVRGTDGVYSFPVSVKGEIEEYTAYLSQYPEAFSACTLSFAQDMPALTVTDRVPFREIQVLGDTAVLIAADKVNFPLWLRRLGFNPDKLNYHTEMDGTVVYVESHGVLFCGAESIAYTASEDGGIPVNEFCTHAGDTDVYAYLRASSAWLSSVSAMNVRYTGGDGELRLTSVYAEEETVTFHFGIYVDNLPLYYDGVPAAVTLSFTGDRLTGMEWRTVVTVKHLNERMSFLASWSRSVLKVNDVRLAYRAQSTVQNTLAEWIAFHGEKEDEWTGIN